MRIKMLVMAACALAAIVFTACGGDDDATTSTGGLEIKGGWLGELPSDVIPKAALFGCPFNMPPEQTAGGVISSAEVRITFDNVPAGKWCVLAFLDVDESDGTMPAVGRDWVATPPAGQAFEIEVTAGEVTSLAVSFEKQDGNGIDTEASGTGTDTETDSDTGTDSNTTPIAPGPQDEWNDISLTLK